jgi:hypothetical protein
MAAVYDGAISALYGAEYAKKLRRTVFLVAKDSDTEAGRSEGSSNTVDMIFEMMRQDGYADDPWEFRFKDGRWQCNSPEDFAGLSVKGAIARSLTGQRKGWYFFGASASEAYHSLVLAVEHQDRGQKIYWFDQFSDGHLEPRQGSFATGTTDVTNNLDNALARVKGQNPTKLWPLCARTRVQARYPRVPA